MALLHVLALPLGGLGVAEEEEEEEEEEEPPPDVFLVHSQRHKEL